MILSTILNFIHLSLPPLRISVSGRVSLSTHCNACLTCRSKFPSDVSSLLSVSVLFDGVSLCVCIDNVPMTFGRAWFESPGYSHCKVFSRFLLLMRNSSATTAQCLTSCVHDDPAWLHYVDECYEVNLNGLPASILSTSARTLPSGKSVVRKKHEYVCAILSDFITRRTEISVMSDTTLLQHLSTLSLPPNCPANRCTF